jgi:hypothetical protein
MQRLVIVAPLSKGTEEQAAKLIAAGPPFDPEETELERHGVYLSAGEVVFVFEGEDVERQVDELMGDLVKPAVRDAIRAWEPLLEDSLRVAEESYFWERKGRSGAHGDPSGAAS